MKYKRYVKERIAFHHHIALLTMEEILNIVCDRSIVKGNVVHTRKCDSALKIYQILLFIPMWISLEDITLAI